MTSAKFNTNTEPTVETHLNPAMPSPATILEARPENGCNAADYPFPVPLTESVVRRNSSKLMFGKPLRTDFAGNCSGDMDERRPAWLLKLTQQLSMVRYRSGSLHVKFCCVFLTNITNLAGIQFN